MLLSLYTDSLGVCERSRHEIEPASAQRLHVEQVVVRSHVYARLCHLGECVAFLRYIVSVGECESPVNLLLPKLGAFALHHHSDLSYVCGSHHCLHGCAL